MEALKSQAQAQPPIDAQALIATEAAKIHSEMKTDREDLHSKIESVNDSLAGALSTTTAPLTAAIKSLQESQQFVFGFFQKFVAPQLQPQLLQLQQQAHPVLHAPPPSALLPPIPEPSTSAQGILQNQNFPPTNANTTQNHTPASVSQNNKKPLNPAIRLPKVKVEPGAKI